MASVLVGYTGGKKEHPTYHQLEMHTESVQIAYDPVQISYEKLLGIFWGNHRSTSPNYSPQYASIIFYHSEEQRSQAEASRAAVEAKLGKKLFTEIRPASTFWPAEDYHQKYYLRRFKAIMSELLERYGEPGAMARSTAAARLNAFAGGFGRSGELEMLLPELGLSEVAGKALLERVKAKF